MAETVMSRTYRLVSLAFIVTVGMGGAYLAYRSLHPARNGLLSEQINHEGNAWKADFTARIAAPEPSVFNAIRDVEHGHSEGVKDLHVLSDTGVRKTVEMELAGPAGQTLITRLVFQYFPSENRITYRTLGNGDFITQAEYRLEPEGSSTLVRFHEVATVREALPVPDGVIKHLIRKVFLAQLDDLDHKLHIRSADTPSEDTR
jgi:carbon monoxide dehydrogenase subunit G